MSKMTEEVDALVAEIKGQGVGVIAHSEGLGGGEVYFEGRDDDVRVASSLADFAAYRAGDESACLPGVKVHVPLAAGEPS